MIRLRRSDPAIVVVFPESRRTPETMSVMTIDAYGTKEWHKDGKLHREDGPAVEDVDGSLEWWIDGKYKDGKFHR